MTLQECYIALAADYEDLVFRLLTLNSDVVIADFIGLLVFHVPPSIQPKNAANDIKKTESTDKASVDSVFLILVFFLVFPHFLSGGSMIKFIFGEENSVKMSGEITVWC